MFYKYIMKDDQDRRGVISLTHKDKDGNVTAYTSIEVPDSDMTLLKDTEKDEVCGKLNKPWLSYRDYYKHEIDLLADIVRSSHKDIGQNTIDIEYSQVYDVLMEWVDKGRPLDDVPDEVQVWADVNNQSLEWAEEDIRVAIGTYRTIIRTIRTIRLTAKAHIDKVASNEVLSTYNHFRSQLIELKNTIQRT